MTREQLIEMHEPVLRRTCEQIGEDFDQCQDMIDFTASGAVVFGIDEEELLPCFTIDPEYIEDYLGYVL